ncbi:MAG: MFS transporter [Spirochaetaceae bacterium]
MNHRTEVLSARERDTGLSYFMMHITWNGLGVFLLNQTIVSLMAIHFGASNLELGYIGSAFHVAGIASLFVPRLFRGARINKLFGWGWMIRGFFAVLYVFLLFMNDLPARIFILVVFTAFCVSRAIGISVAHAVQSDFMRARNASSALVKLNIRLAWAQLVSQLLSFGLLSIAVLEGILGLIIISLIGVLMNTVAAWYLLKLPGRAVVEPKPDRGTLQTFLWSMKRRHHAIPLLVHGLGMGLVVLFGFQVVFLRRVLGLPNNIAILLVVLEAVSALIANSALKPFADNIGDRPLLVISTLGLTVVALIWAFIPPTLPVPVYFGLGFIAFFFKRSLLTLKGSVMVKSVPQNNRVAYTSAANVMLAVIALVVGLVGGALADASSLFPGLIVHDYTLTFLFTAALSVVALVLSTQLAGDRDLSLRETADIMFSVRNLRAFIDAYQLDFAADPAQRETLLLSLERSVTTVATSRLRERLSGPHVSERERVLRTLFRSPRSELLPDIIAEARDRASFTRREAIFCLGAYRDPAAEAVLRETAGLPVVYAATAAAAAPPAPDPDIEAVCISLKSLARVYTALEDGEGSTAPQRREVLSRIRELLDRNEGHGPGSLRPGLPAVPPRGELDLRLAESLLDPEGPQLKTLFEDATRYGSPRFAMTRFMIAFRRLGLDPGLDAYIRSEVRHHGRGFEELIEDASEFAVFQAQRAQLLRWIRLDEYVEVLTWLAGQIDALWPNDNASSDESSWAVKLRTAVTRYVHTMGESQPDAELQRITVLAGLYVLHQVLASEEPSGRSVE